jgi:hypothetical protein
MTRETQEDRTIALNGIGGIRNPYGVMDVPNPNGQEVVEFAADASLDGSTDDENGSAWNAVSESAALHSIEGIWSSRWNGGADPTIVIPATLSRRRHLMRQRRQRALDQTVADLGGRHHRFRMELHRRDRQPGMLDRHHHAVGRRRRHG